MTGMTRTTGLEDAAATAAGDDTRWLLRLWLLAGSFTAIMLVWSWQVGVPFRDPGGVILRNRVAVSLLLFALLLAVDVVVRRSSWSRRRVGVVVAALLAYHVVYASYRNLKSWTAFNDDRDDFLARTDDWLFLGHSPAGLLHDLLGERLAAQSLAALYESFATLVTVSLVAALVFTPRLRDGFAVLASAMWLWVLGLGSYYLIPSLGPFATAPQQFAHLADTIITTKQAKLLADRAQLLADPSATDAFASISAFASLHTAFTFLILLVVRHHGLRWATRVMTVVFLGTVLATIYFGWHFVIDDVAGVALALAAFKLGRLTVSSRSRSGAVER